MLLAVSALDVALATAIAGGIVGLASPLSTWLVAKGQRKADQAARVYRDKLEAYQTIARDAYRGRELVGECAERLAKADDATAKALVDQLDTALNALHATEPDALAGIGVVAPAKVLTAHAAFVQAWNAATDELLWQVDRNQPGFAAKAKPAADRAIAALTAPFTRSAT
jgi:hypothetical protein